MSTAAIRRHWDRVVALGCAVHGPGCAAEVAHLIGKPSVTERVLEPKPKGRKLPRHDWLAIGLCPAAHRLYCWSLDNSPKEWEARFGKCADILDAVAERLGVDVWALSQQGRKS